MKTVEKQFILKIEKFSYKYFVFIFTLNWGSKESNNQYADTPDLEI